MQDNTPSQFGSQATPTSSEPNQADKEWSDLQRDLDILGRQLAELTTHTAQLGETFLTSLQARFQDVKDRADTYRRATEHQFEEMRETAVSEADSTFSDIRARSSEAAKQVWERSEPLRQGARDVGEGMFRAWSEIRASLGKAAGRLNTEQSTANGPSPAPERRSPRNELEASLSRDSSCPDLIRASSRLRLRIDGAANGMDCRVKPGNDDRLWVLV